MTVRLELQQTDTRLPFRHVLLVDETTLKLGDVVELDGQRCEVMVVSR